MTQAKRRPKPTLGRKPKYNFDDMEPGQGFYYEGTRSGPIIAYGYHKIKGLYTTEPHDNGWIFRLRTFTDEETVDKDAVIHFSIHVGDELLTQIDNWRGQRNYTRSEAIKQLITKGITKNGGK